MLALIDHNGNRNTLYRRRTVMASKLMVTSFVILWWKLIKYVVYYCVSKNIEIMVGNCAIKKKDNWELIEVVFRRPYVFELLLSRCSTVDPIFRFCVHRF